MEERLKKLEKESKLLIEKAKNLTDIEDARIKYLGRKGEIPALMKGIKDLPSQEKKKIGQFLNKLRSELEELIKARSNDVGNLNKSLEAKSGATDITLPGKGVPRGRPHTITQIMEQVKGIFLRLGYSVAEGPDVETDYYNFEALNMPPHHAARDMWSTLYISDKALLRTHTSPVQIRVMEKKKPPLAIIAPGRVYRRDADITHSPVFHQLEGLFVDKNITFADLKGTLITFLRELFGSSRKVRFRPSYFPFTEPSAEVDVECILCGGLGCRTCSQTGWLEILGAGMVDPNVFESVGYDPEVYSGFAFGMGIERIAMLKFGIDDIRVFFDNDMRFLKQF